MNKNKNFEKIYLDLRNKESRIYTIQQIKNLPFAPHDDIHAKEWKLRKDTFNRFYKYYQNRSWKSVLDLACGNGWFLNKIYNPNSNFLGVEINNLELQQAREILKHNKNVSFMFGDIFKLELENKFDLIIINAAIQYFNPLNEILSKLNSLLSPNGEIHILDSPFYKNSEEATKAKERSKIYYSSENINEMNNFYFHHCIVDLSNFPTKIMYNPNNFKNRILKKLGFYRSPFPWIIIKHLPYTRT